MLNFSTFKWSGFSGQGHVLGCGARLALMGGGGLEHERLHGDYAGAGRVDGGGVATQTHARSDC